MKILAHALSELPLLNRHISCKCRRLKGLPLALHGCCTMEKVFVTEKKISSGAPRQDILGFWAYPTPGGRPHRVGVLTWRRALAFPKVTQEGKDEYGPRGRESKALEANKMRKRPRAAVMSAGGALTGLSGCWALCEGPGVYR
jgi:hypothetical protein